MKILVVFVAIAATVVSVLGVYPSYYSYNYGYEGALRPVDRGTYQYYDVNSIQLLRNYIPYTMYGNYLAIPESSNIVEGKSVESIEEHSRKRRSPAGKQQNKKPPTKKPPRKDYCDILPYPQCVQTVPWDQ